MEASNYVPVHPNQHRGESRATRAAVILLLVVTAVLTTIVTVAGAPVAGSSGMQLFAFVYIILLVVMAYYVYKWSRGVLAMAAALAVLFGLLMIVAAAGWFQRDQAGFAEPLLPAAVIGLITIVLVPVQLLLVAFAMRGFNQAWNIEVLVPEEEAKENLADKFDEGGRRVEHEDDEGGDEEEHG